MLVSNTIMLNEDTVSLPKKVRTRRTVEFGLSALVCNTKRSLHFLLKFTPSCRSTSLPGVSSSYKPIASTASRTGDVK